MLPGNQDNGEKSHLATYHTAGLDTASRSRLPQLANCSRESSCIMHRHRNVCALLKQIKSVMTVDLFQGCFCFILIDL